MDSLDYSLNDKDGTKFDYEMLPEDVYMIALRFFKEQKEKAFHMSYASRIRMTALICQAKHGQMVPNSASETGVFDVVGRDIRRHWETLGAVSKEQAMHMFVEQLTSACPQFSAFLAATVREAAAAALIRHQKEQERLKCELQREKEEQVLREGLQLENLRRMEQENRLRMILNEQTLPQFRQYAAQQHPTDVKAQERLIAQLQQHHFHQYMLAVYERTTCNNDVDDEPISSTDCPPSSDNNVNILPVENGLVLCEDLSQQQPQTTEYNITNVETWQQSNIDEFRAAFKEDPTAVLKVGSGEVVTIKVPSASCGSQYLQWQFLTDDHDIGFGMTVAWDDRPGSTAIDLVPVLRRDSHKQVHCGRLRLPAHGELSLSQPHFLLRFDNSYSLWRHKWLYYRVFYSD